MRRTPMVHLDRLSIQYGPLRAVDRVSLQIEAGQIFGLLGPNGSGKSSTLAAIAGILRPAEGSISIAGLNSREHANEYARCIGFVPQEIALYEEMTVWDNLAFFGQLYGLCGKTLRRRVETCLHLVQMMPYAQKPTGTLSGGMQRRANLACALLHDPAVLLLDEPTVALDPASRDVLFTTLDSLRRQGKAIVLTTHHPEDAERWCDRAGVLQQGRLVAEGRPAALFHEGPHRAIILGQMRHHLAELLEVKARSRLGTEVAFEVWGRQIRLEAPDQQQLGQALATLSAAGVELESFRTPPACMNRLLGIVEADGEPTILPFAERREVAWAA